MAVDSEELEFSRVLVSYPRSGRTWLWYAASQAIAKHYGLTLEAKALLNIDKHKLFREAGLPLATSTHDTANAGTPKLRAEHLVILRRHPLDIIVSAFHWRVIEDWNWHIETESTMLGSWAKSWTDDRRTIPTIAYEQLHENFRAVLTWFLEWLGVPPVSDETLAFAEQQASFPAMHATAPHKARKGKAGAWRQTVTKRDQERIWAILDDYPSDMWDIYRES